MKHHKKQRTITFSFLQTVVSLKKIKGNTIPSFLSMYGRNTETFYSRVSHHERLISQKNFKHSKVFERRLYNPNICVTTIHTLCSYENLFCLHSLSFYLSFAHTIITMQTGYILTYFAYGRS